MNPNLATGVPRRHFRVTFRAPLAAAVLAVALAACDRPRSAADGMQKAAASGTTPAPSSAAALGPLATVAEPIDTLTTLGRWLAAHPGDVALDHATEGLWDAELCRAAKGVTDGTGGRVTRTALFDLPDAPAGEALPATMTPEESCHLRAVELSVAVPDTLRGDVLADSIATALDAALGAGRAGALVQHPRGTWRRGRTWAGRGTTVVLAEIPDEPPSPPHFEGDGDVAPVARRVAVVVFAPSSALDIAAWAREVTVDTALASAERMAMRSLADSALAAVAEPALTARLAPVYAAIRAAGASMPERTLALDSALVAAAVLVHDQQGRLPRGRRAAALTALDHAVSGLAGQLSPRAGDGESPSPDEAMPDSALSAALAPAGVTYDEEPSELRMSYPHDLLVAAHAADSLGGGHRAFLMLTAMGWETRSECASGSDQFDAVIAHGDAAVARGDGDPLLRYYLGTAYSDVASLAQHPDGYHSAAKYQRRAPAARVRAIVHLRAALAGLTDPALRRDAWRRASALMLGQSRGTRYFCYMVD